MSTTTPTKIFRWIVVGCFLSPFTAASFVHHPCCHHRVQHQSSSLSLIPISKFRNEIEFLDQLRNDKISKDGIYYDKYNNNDEYLLGLVEQDDLPDTAQFVIDAFGADVISLAKGNDWNTLERALITPTVALLNSYSGLVAYAEVFTGLQFRTTDRIKPNSNDLSAPKLDGASSEPDQVKQSEKSSLILILAKPKSKTDDPTKPNWQKLDIIASVELRLQLTDAKIPFSYPWLDRLERKLASLFWKNKYGGSKKLQPYLSNLCVDEKYRRQNLGRSLVQCLEDIARTKWGYHKLYLHVDQENRAAVKLYQQEGYKSVQKRWQPFWAGDLSNINYLVKKL
mmetsp:Transcript_32733/g.49330  ORF Transcript_32733/g.49330 Transcript_32733/m.49330 type:complete len:339 (-) Transcript_32733:29-1045(-)